MFHLVYLALNWFIVLGYPFAVFLWFLALSSLTDFDILAQSWGSKTPVRLFLAALACAGLALCLVPLFTEAIPADTYYIKGDQIVMHIRQDEFVRQSTADHWATLGDRRH